MPAQIFEYGFHGDFTSIKPPLMRLDHFLVLFDGIEQASSSFADRHVCVAEFVNRALQLRDGIVVLYAAVVQPPKRFPELVKVSKLHSLTHDPGVDHPSIYRSHQASVPALFGDEFLVIGGRQQLIGLARIL
jgi:hypothetical protein